MGDRHRRFTAKFTIEADDHAELLHALESIARRCDMEEILTRPGDGVSAGYTYSYSYGLSIDTNVTGDSYREALLAEVADRRAERRGAV